MKKSKSGNKKTSRIKAIALILLVLAVVILSAIAPRKILQWKNHKQLETFTPLRNKGGSLSGEGIYVLEVINDAYYTQSEAYLGSSGREMAGVIKEMTEEYGIIPSDIGSALLYTLNDSFSIEESVQKGESHSIVTMQIRTPDNEENTSLQIIYEEGNRKILGINTLIPYECFLNYDSIEKDDYLNFIVKHSEYYQEYLDGYIKWLDLWGIDDWAYRKTEEPMNALIAYSQYAGIEVHILLSRIDKAILFQLFVRPV